MTLNITILSENYCISSADYKLSSEANINSYSENSTKLVVISQENWQGFITYTGIGKIGTLETSSTVKNWLAGIDQKSTMKAVGELIRSKASQWMKRMHKPNPHTFIIIGREEGSSRAMIISNFQDNRGNYFKISNTFHIFYSKYENRELIIFTGYTYERNNSTYNKLFGACKRQISTYSMDNKDNIQLIRRKVSKINQSIARLRPNIISQDCYVASIDAFGTSNIENFGRTIFRPKHILQGIDIEKIIIPFLDKMFGAGGWTTVAAKSFGIAEKADLPVCRLKIENEGSPMQAPLLLQTHQMGASMPCWTTKDRKVVVGQAGHHPCVWRDLGPCHILSREGERGGIARWVGESGIAFGHIVLADGAQVACSWSVHHGTRTDFGSTAGRITAAMRGNRLGDVVGWAILHPTEHGQQHFRPAFWAHTGWNLVMRDIPGEWGEAVDVNDEGVGLVRLHIRNESGGFLWCADGLHWIGAPTEDTRALYPEKIFNDGSVASLAILKNGDRLFCLRQPDGRWLTLVPPLPGRAVCRINDARTMIGFDEIAGYRRPWIKKDGSPISYLQYFSHHNHNLTCINESNEILGFASSDHCYHPISWNINGV